ncbi:PIN domain-like protein [Hypoxylon sp. FL1150]|nr:PIN domain-like protein [Hypoxylon sp. FL1150]
MGLWQFSLKERATGETRSITQWSSEHFQRHGRPLRIAIDQANWWFRNIPPEKALQIQKQSPGSHPREKRILDRIGYLLRMNVQLVFVFDGPNKPSKIRRLSGQLYSESSLALLKELLDQLGVPRLQAPGEAEAECARLQQLGIVDAVWSDDSDTFMFGCTVLVQFHKLEGHDFNSEDTVLVYRADSLLSHSNLTKEGLLMHAVLVGCDYTNGLFGFGSGMLLEIAKHRGFQEAAALLASSTSNPRELNKWRAMLVSMVKDKFPNKSFPLPPNTFPDLQILKSCARPTVSPDTKLASSVTHWFRPFGHGMVSRFKFLLDHFHSRKPRTWPADFLVPIELNHRLRERLGSGQDGGPDYSITEKTPIGPRKETTISVDPLLVIPELWEAFPPSWLDPRTGMKPEFKPVNVTILDCVVQQGMPHLLEKSTKKPRGRPRKATAGANDSNREGPAKMDSTVNRRGRSNKGAPTLSKHNGQSPVSGTMTQAATPDATVRNKRNPEGAPVIVIDDDDEVDSGSNGGDPGETRQPYKKRKSDLSIPAGISAIDLTEAS